MKTVWKYQFTDLSWDQHLSIPRGAILRLFGFQHAPCLWFEVDTEATPEDRWFKIVGTGHEIPDGAAHLGSINMFHNSAWWAWHLYEKSN